MPRPDVKLRADEADDLLDRLESLRRGLDEHPEETLADWGPEIHRIYWAVKNAVGDAEARASAPAYRRDMQRRKVYRAEAAVDGGRPRYDTPASQAWWLMNAVLNEPWFRQRFPEIDGATVKVTRSRAAKCSTYRWAFTGKLGGQHRLELVERAPDSTILHELAHACHRVWYGAQAPGHDANFVGILVWLTANALGREAAVALVKALNTAGVKATPFVRQQRTTTPPPPVQVARLDPIAAILRRM
jgi:putative metallohydrolase (TIGR04338 family)